MVVTAVLLIVECFLCSLLSPTESTDMVAISFIMLILNSAVTFVGINNSVGRNDRRIASVLSVSLILHLIVMFWNIYFNNVFTLPNTDGDAEAYATIATSYAFGSRAGLPIDLTRFPSYVGKLYQLIGEQRITVQFINVYLAMCALVYVYRILIMLNVDEDIVHKGLRILAILPNLLIISSAFLQESIIAFLLVFSVYCFVKWYQYQGGKWLAFAIAVSLFASLFHMGGCVCAVSFAVTAPLVGRERKVSLNIIRILLAAIVVFAFLIFLTQNGSSFLRKFGGDYSAEKILYETEVRESGGSGYYIGISGLPASLDLIVNTPIRMIYFMFSPLPWQWRGLSDIVAFFGSTLFYIVSTKWLINVFRRRQMIKNNPLYGIWFAIVIACLIAGIMFGWGVSNAGSALRHREKFTYLFGLIYMLSIYLERKSYEISYSNSSSI